MNEYLFHTQTHSLHASTNCSPESQFTFFLGKARGEASEGKEECEREEGERRKDDGEEEEEEGGRGGEAQKRKTV